MPVFVANNRAPSLRSNSPTSLKSPLATISETSLEHATADSDDGSSPSLASTPSLCSSRTQSFDSDAFPVDASSASTPTVMASPVEQDTGVPAVPMRRNEHLAVLIPKYLWKPDSQASHCETYSCRTRFTLFERKHHCRKCGGIFCAKCSARVTPLLDTTHLDFLHPPRDVPISAYDSPESPVEAARICDDCYVQLHGRDDAPSATSAVAAQRRGSDSASASSLSSVATPPEGRPPMRRSDTAPSPRKSRRSRPSSRSSSPPQSHPALAPSPVPSFGDLDNYPLRFHSSICKATGGGRWEPKPIRNWDGHRIPGGKAPFEIVLEKQAEEERLRKLNPIIRDGVIQLRAPRAPEPTELRKPIERATF